MEQDEPAEAEIFRRKKTQIDSNLTDEPNSSLVPDNVSVAWKTTFDTLTICVKYPQLAGQTTRLLINSLIEHLAQDPAIMFPDETAYKTIDQLHESFECYNEFLAGLSNLFFRFLTQELGQNNSVKIYNFYSILLNKLHGKSEALFLFLMEKFVMCLKAIVETYLKNPNHNIPVGINVFVPAKPVQYLTMKFVPVEAFIGFSINHLKNATELVIFCTKLIYENIRFLQGTYLQNNAISVLCKRFLSIDEFGVQEMKELYMLRNMDLKIYPELLPVMDELMNRILLNNCGYTNSKVDLYCLEEHIVKGIFNSENQAEYWCQLQMVQNLKNEVLKIAVSSKTLEKHELKRGLVLTHIIKTCPGLVKMGESDVKCLAKKFCLDLEGFALTVLMAYMDSELQLELPLLIAQSNVMCSNDSQLSPEKFHQRVAKWYSAENCSTVWMIMKGLFLTFLERLGAFKPKKEEEMNNPGTSELDPIPSAKPYEDLCRVCSILKELSFISYNLEKLQQNSEQVANAYFRFFPNELEEIVEKFLGIPMYCLSVPTTGDDSKLSADQWEEFLDVIHYFRQLPEVWELGQDDLCILDALAGLLWLNDDKHERPAMEEEHVQLMVSYAKKLRTSLDHWEEKASDFFDSRYLDPKGSIIKSFFSKFHQIKERATSWRAHVLELSLKTQSNAFKVIAIRNVPLVIASCHKVDIPKLLQCLEDLRSVKDLDVDLQLAKTVPLVVCAISGKCDLVKISNITKYSSYMFPSVELKVVCNECDDDGKHLNHRGWNALDLWTNFTEIWSSLMQHPNYQVRTTMARGICRVCKHLGSSLKASDISIWMKLLQDDCYCVVTEIAPHVSLLFTSHHKTEKVTQQLFEVVFCDLKEATFKNICSRSQAGWQIFLYVFYNIIKVPHSFILIPIAKLASLLIAVGNEYCYHITQTMVAQLADVHNISPKVLFWQISEEVWKIIVDALVITTPDERDVVICLKKFSNIFGVEEKILQKQLYRLLVQLIPRCVQDKTLWIIVNDIAFYTENTKQAMLTKWYPLIYAVIELEQSPEIAQESNKLMISWMVTPETEDDIEFNNDYRSLRISRLMNEFHSQKEKVLSVIRKIYFEWNETEETFVTEENLKKFLEPHYLGILVNLQKTVLQKYAGDDMKLKALNSLSALVQFMGKKSFSPFYVKTLNSLCTFSCLTNPHLCEAFCKLVDVFIRHVNHEHLEQSVIIVMTTVMHLDWKMFYDPIKRIVDYIFIDMKDYIQKIVFDLASASDFLVHFGHKKFVCVTQMAFKKLEFHEALHFHTQLINSRHEKSQIIGLCALKTYIAENQERMQKYLFGRIQNHSEFKNTLGKLLDNCSSSNPEIRTLCVEILASIGAIDPKHWEVANGFYCKTSLTLFYIDAMCPNFAVTAFDILVEEFQAMTKNSDMNIIAFVCQEFMKALEFQDEPAKAPVEIWNIIEESIKLAIMPFFRSSYYSAIHVSVSNLPHPIFGSTHGTTFESWLFNWVCRLIDMIQNPKAKKAFTALKWIFKLNLRCTKFFLPHIFIYAVWYASTSNRTLILEEITAAARLIPRTEPQDNAEVASDMFESLNLSCSLQKFSSLDCNESVSPLQVKAAQVIFHLIDYMFKWKLEFEWIQQEAKEAEERANPPCITLSSSSSSSSSSDSLKLSQMASLSYRHKAVKYFLGKLCMAAVSESSHMCNENFRALRYLEMFTVQNLASLQSQLNLFLRIYVQLNEEKSVSGVVATMETHANAAAQILVHELTGQLQDAVISYGMLIGNDDPNSQIIRNMAKAYLNLGEYHSVLAFAEKHGQSANLSDNDFMIAIKLEVLWSMGSWEVLKQVLDQNKASRPTFASHFACILVAMHSGKLGVAKSEVANVHKKLGGWLYKSSFKSDMYADYYSAFVFNHITVEIEIVIHLMELHAANAENNSQTEETWTQYVCGALDKMAMYERRVSTAWRTYQQLLAMRRTLLSLLHQVLLQDYPVTAAFIQKQIGILWLKSAKIAISHRQFSQALNYTMNADKCNMQEAFVIRSQIEWETGKHDAAIVYLKRGIKSQFPDEAEYMNMPIEERKEERLICSKARLLIAEYSCELKIANAIDSVRLFRDAVNAYPFSEETLVKYSRAWQILKKDKQESHNDEKYLKMLVEEVRGYSKALTYGIQYLHESLPRCISIWANIGLTIYKLKQQKTKSTREEQNLLLPFFKQLHDIIIGLKEKIPLYAYYACFTQLSSRLCHPHKSIYVTIQNIFLLLLEKYPHQMLWKLVPMLKLSQPVRVNRVQGILAQFRKRNPSKANLADDYSSLIDALYSFGFTTPKSKAQINMKHLGPNLPRLVSRDGFGPIMMPTQQMLMITLPTEDVTDYKSHNAFPREPVFMVNILDQVAIIASLQRPKTFVIKGSDNVDYNWLIKTKDDLRIDSLVMEFMQVLNTLMQHDPECKELDLSCQTYSVVPLGDDCGLIEWLPDLVQLRATMHKVYKGIGQKHNAKHDIKKYAKLEEKLRIFEEYLLPSHPPVLGNWYIQQFPDDMSWFAARNKFIHSTAVMSMLGYILGLGDRHGGNIMLNVVTGQAVHVDFNCLFNKGEQLPWPEKVPFRLTHNIVRCMGGTGIEGPFSHTCELLLGLMRQNVNTLMAVVRPVLYNSLCKDRINDSSPVDDEFYNHALTASVNRVKLRLSGYVNDKERANGSAESILSPKGQAQAIIKQATDNKNLCLMYPGWAAFV